MLRPPSFTSARMAFLASDAKVTVQAAPAMTVAIAAAGAVINISHGSVGAGPS